MRQGDFYDIGHYDSAGNPTGGLDSAGNPLPVPQIFNPFQMNPVTGQRAPFAGNIPEFDLLAANARGAAIPIQVKAIRSASWQFQIQQFLDVQMRGSRQHVSGRKRLTNPDLICIFVRLRDDSNPEDEFYIFTLRELQTHFHSTYKSRVRPRNPNSFHCALRPQALKAHKNNLSHIEKKMKSQ